MSIKLIINLQANIFIILMIIIKYIPFQISIGYFYIPEVLPLLVYVIYLLKKNILSDINILILSLLDDLLKFNYISTTVQNLIYIFYLDCIRKKYTNSVLFDWLFFSIVSSSLLTFQYIVINLFQRCSILSLNLIFKQISITIFLFPLIYYLVNKLLFRK